MRGIASHLNYFLASLSSFNLFVIATYSLALLSGVMASVCSMSRIILFSFSTFAELKILVSHLLLVSASFTASFCRSDSFLPCLNKARPCRLF